MNPGVLITGLEVNDSTLIVIKRGEGSAKSQVSKAIEEVKEIQKRGWMIGLNQVTKGVLEGQGEGKDRREFSMEW